MAFPIAECARSATHKVDFSVTAQMESVLVITLTLLKGLLLLVTYLLLF